VVVLCDSLDMRMKSVHSGKRGTDPFGTFEEILDELTAL